MNPPADASLLAPPIPESRPSLLNSALLIVTQAISSNLELPNVLQTILEHMMILMDAQQGSVLLWDRERDSLEMVASCGLPEHVTRNGYIPRKGSIAAWVIQHDEPLVLHGRPNNAPYRAMGNRPELTSSLCVPLRVTDGVIGAVNLNRVGDAQDPFSREDLEWTVALSGEAAIFIENCRLHDRIVQTERLAAVGQTVAGISHCVKNILTGVQGGVSLVDIAYRQQQWDMVERAHGLLKRSVQRMSSIVLDMLDLSKERESIKQSVALEQVIDEVFSTVSTQAHEKEVTLEKRRCDEWGAVSADPGQLFRCLLNLIGNAVDATPQGGEVWVTYERAQDDSVLKHLRDTEARAAVTIRVGDTGPGVDAAHYETIFDPFFSTKGSRGTGLGLAVTRKIIEEHGGSLTLESPPDHPAVFAICLPD